MKRFMVLIMVLILPLSALAWKGDGPSSGGGVWGSITGTLSAQTDLKAVTDALFPKALFKDSADVALARLDSTFVGANKLAISDVNNLETRLQAATGMSAAAFGDSLKNRHKKAEADTFSIAATDKIVHRKTGTLSIYSDTLEVRGILYMNNDGNTNKIIGSTNRTAYMDLRDSGTGNYILSSEGGFNFKTGTTTEKLTLSTTKATFADSVISAGFRTASDRRIKDNITNIPYGLDEIMKLIPRQYEIKGTHGIGFVAQEVDPIIPEIVYKDSLWTVDYDGVIPVLVKAVQEQQREIALLKIMLAFALFFSAIAFARTFRRRQ